MLHPKAGQYDEEHFGDEMPYSKVAVGDTESRQIAKMGPTSGYVTKVIYSKAPP